ncbi:hypothetical protein ES319_D12G125000v1 [Gossypium barbadense]|uniref:BHLH domain-containing protein n=1 Tax=Gossypium barbadense TaxID=3634 RepID=A0A5J5NXW4_GOSBA|nr:hypothetical protein ES319_D12G125000v1 [Gossypium barbadense]
MPFPGLLATRQLWRRPKRWRSRVTMRRWLQLLVKKASRKGKLKSCKTQRLLQKSPRGSKPVKMKEKSRKLQGQTPTKVVTTRRKLLVMLLRRIQRFLRFKSLILSTFGHVVVKPLIATDSHSLAKRVRREKISERMKYLQDLVPGCNKITGKAGMLDEIINYVQSLQRKVEVKK